MEWRMDEAQERLDEVITRALVEGPQRVVSEENAVVILSAEDYERMVERKGGYGLAG